MKNDSIQNPSDGMSENDSKNEPNIHGHDDEHSDVM